MRKQWIFSLFASMGMFLIVFLSRRKKQGAKSEYFPLESAGKPDQIDHIDDAQQENSDMVSEGSIYGVQYYNEMAQEHQ